MASKPQFEKKFKFNKTISLGSPDAETDNMLDNVFLENGNLTVLKDIHNPKCIILGRTGTGKSALIRQLEKAVDKVVRLDPESMSLRFLSNSTIINYLREYEVNLDFFYKVLWKHVFVVELLKLHFGDSPKKRETWLDNLSDKFSRLKGNRNPARDKALNYLREWSDEFWQNREYRIRNLEHVLTQNIGQSLGVNVDILSANLGLDQNIINRTETEVKHKAESVINDIQAAELFEIIQIMKDELFENTQTKYYIVIDDLDKEWVSEQIVYDLLASLIEVIKEFRILKSVKIIIALRENLNDMVFSGKRHRGGQREKFSSLYLPLTWSTEELSEVIDKRLRFVSNGQATITKTLKQKSRREESGMEYIINRTFMRPREVISYFNKIIEKANSKSYFPINLIKQAEAEYSRERLIALEDEWAENYGEIAEVCKLFTGKHNGFRLINVKDDWFADYYIVDTKTQYLRGKLADVFNDWKADRIKFKSFVIEFFALMYRVGFIGIKKDANHSVNFVYQDKETLSARDISSDSRFYVHKSFYSVLKINTKEQEVDYLD